MIYEIPGQIQKTIFGSGKGWKWSFVPLDTGHPQTIKSLRSNCFSSNHETAGSQCDEIFLIFDNGGMPEYKGAAGVSPGQPSGI